MAKLRNQIIIHENVVITPLGSSSNLSYFLKNTYTELESYVSDRPYMSSPQG
jgi:hypothetical protein